MGGIRTRYLDEEDAERLYAMHPSVKASPDEFCPTCDKSGVYHWKGEDHPCDCEMQLQLLKHYLHAGIGETYGRLDWDDYQGRDRHHEEALRDYVHDHAAIRQGIGLFLSGPKGTGKTMLANLTLKEFVKRGYSCYATTFAQAKEMFTAGWYSADDQAYFARRFLHSEILLLDDIAKEYRTKISETVLDNILRQRAQSAKATMITTNITEGELSESYGSGVLSLLREKALDFMYFDGVDYRPRAAERGRIERANREVRPLV